MFATVGGSNGAVKRQQIETWLATASSQIRSGERFSKATETFLARKAIFSSSVSKSGEAYAPETSCMKGDSLHLERT